MEASASSQFTASSEDYRIILVSKPIDVDVDIARGPYPSSSTSSPPSSCGHAASFATRGSTVHTPLGTGEAGGDSGGLDAGLPDQKHGGFAILQPSQMYAGVEIPYPDLFPGLAEVSEISPLIADDMHGHHRNDDPSNDDRKKDDDQRNDDQRTVM